MTCTEHVGAYIMTIGVVDECRRFGLGTKMIDHTIKILREQWPRCEVIYLHVVSYNEAALKFYERNRFIRHSKIINHYFIMEKDYDAIVLYKDLNQGNDANTDLSEP
jgi:ribosomal protein S18 acetylase RimI-like enzyme